MKISGPLGCLVVLAFIIGIPALMALFLQITWNIVVPSIFGGPSLEYLQAVAFLWLIWLIGAAFRTVVRVRE